MATASEIAQYILSKSNPEEGDIISHLKLQKLLYYCQGFHLAISGTYLFEDEIRHWDHGPVVPAVYAIYKDNGNNTLVIPDEFDDSIIKQAEKDIIDEVLDVYGQFSAWKLRNMTHKESPWENTSDNEKISHELLKEYFSTQLIDKS